MIWRGLLVSFALGLSFTSCNATIYKVIAEPPSGMGVAVVVDESVYQLEPEHGILYKGEAPSAKSGYKYAFVDTSNTANMEVSPESFTRNPVDGDSTLNEFFNRPSNYYKTESLPQTLAPLDSINRIESELHIPNQIPTIHIYGEQVAIDNLHTNSQDRELDVKLNVAYFGLKDVQFFEKVKVSLAGRSTRFVSKLSYTFKLKKKSEAKLFGYKNFKLRALGKDESYIRENICYNVFKSAGIPASEFSYVRLFINNKAIGLFGLIETFQDPWTAAVFGNGDTDYESGHMYQGYGIHSSKKNGDGVSDLGYNEDLGYYNRLQYKVKTGPNKKLVESFDELQEFTKFIYDSTAQTSLSKWDQVIDVEGFLRATALTDLLAMSDSYMAASNNYYLYKDPRKNGRITYIPADTDTSLGTSFFYNQSSLTRGSYADHPGILYRPLTKAILANPEILERYNNIRLSITKKLLNPKVMNPYIDSIVDMIRTDVEWDSSLGRVGTKHSRPEGTRVDISKLYNSIKKYVPPGYVFKYLIESPPNVPLDVAVGGNYPPDNMLSVKHFIAKKSAAVLKFYKNH